MVENGAVPHWAQLAGLGEDPADLATDLHPYLRRLGAKAPRAGDAADALLELAARRLRTRSLTPGGLPQPPEVMGVDADARVPNSLQPMPGELSGGQEVQDGNPGFHNPDQAPATGVAAAETAGPGLLQQPQPAPADAAPDPRLAGLRNLAVLPVGNERDAKPNLAAVRVRTALAAVTKAVVGPPPSSRRPQDGRTLAAASPQKTVKR